MTEKLNGPVPDEIQCLLEVILPKWGNGVMAALFYGSCLRTGVFFNNVVDFYLIVDDLKVYKSSFFALLNKLLPPNVFYVEVPFNGNMLRAKYGIFTLVQFKKMASKNAFHPYLWSRLVQPMRIVYSQNIKVEDEIIRSVYTSTATLITNVVPLLKGRFGIRELWLKAFSLTYKTEIRPEQKGNIVNLYTDNEEFLDFLADQVLDLLPYPIEETKSDTNNYYSIMITQYIRYISIIKWFFRIVYGKILSPARLLKSLFTFENALSYGFYKLSKHTPNVVIPDIFRKNLFFSCMYLFLIGIKRKIFK